MILFVHASPTTLERHRHPCLGVFSSPRRFYREVDGWPWAADNDAYSNWDAYRYVRMLEAIPALPRPVFVTCPDVVGDWAATRAYFEFWQPRMRELPIGYVLQDGQPLDMVPWDHIAAVFVGGSSEWKMGNDARCLVAEAKKQGLWAHMGRVNGHRRVRYAKAIGCDSIDGTSLSWFRDRWLRDFLDHAAAPVQGLLA